jgi:hypothetical protein
MTSLANVVASRAREPSYDRSDKSPKAIQGRQCDCGKNLSKKETRTWICIH